MIRDLNPYYDALLRAHRAGDTDGAQHIANVIKRNLPGASPIKEAMITGIESAPVGRASPAGAALLGATGEIVRGVGAVSQLFPDKYTPDSLKGAGGNIADVGEAMVSKAYSVNTPGAFIGQAGSYIVPTNAVTNTARTALRAGAPKTLLGSAVENAAVGGGMAYATTPGSQDERVAPAATSAAIASAIPYIGTNVHRGAQTLLDKAASRVSPEVKLLYERGVIPTIGQALGGAVKSIEDRATSLPFVGSMINNLRQRGYASFNRAAFDEVLAPLRRVGVSPVSSASKDVALRTPGAPAAKETAPLTLDVEVPRETGRAAFEKIETQVSDAYKKVLPRMRFAADDEFNSAVNMLKEGTSQQPGDIGKAFAYDVDQIIYKKLKASRNGEVDGQAVKDIQSEIRALVDTYKGTRGSEDRLGKAYGALDDALGAALKRLNPRYAADLDAVDAAYARLNRLRGAGSMANTEQMFTPGQFASAVRRQDKTGTKRAYASGEALMQELSDAAVQVLPSKYPNSGTADRLLLSGAGTAGVGMGGIPWEALPIYGALGIPYLDGTSKYIAKRLVEGRSPDPKSLARTLRKTGLPAGLATGVTSASDTEQ